VAVTKLVEPVEGRYQAAIRKGEGYKPRKCRVGMADDMRMIGRQNSVMREGEHGTAFSGSQAAAWYRRENVGTWEVLADSPVRGITADKPKRVRRQ
jgi:hypothetical protein